MESDRSFISLLDVHDRGIERVREEIWHWPEWERRIFFDTTPSDKQIEWERERYTKDSM
jgi:hypothetical protein